MSTITTNTNVVTPPVASVELTSPCLPTVVSVAPAMKPSPAPMQKKYHNVFLHICDICFIESDARRALIQMACDDYFAILSCLTLQALSDVRLTPVDDPQGTPYALNWGSVSRC